MHSVGLEVMLLRLRRHVIEVRASRHRNVMIGCL